MDNGVTRGCGQCLGCRSRRRDEWAGRILMEARYHESSIFATLTYDPLTCPLELSKRDVQLFVKRLRKTHKFRYFACGEYGERTGRPHYHVILFGLLPDDEQCIQKSWSNGFVSCSLLTPARARYVAKYVLKFESVALDGQTLPRGSSTGRQPEFSLMSRRPGIGLSALSNLADQLLRRNIGMQHVRGTGDMTTTSTAMLSGSYRLDGKLYPFDRTTKQKFAQKMGGFVEPDIKIPQIVAEQDSARNVTGDPFLDACLDAETLLRLSARASTLRSRARSKL